MYCPLTCLSFMRLVGMKLRKMKRCFIYDLYEYKCGNTAMFCFFFVFLSIQMKNSPEPQVTLCYQNYSQGAHAVTLLWQITKVEGSEAWIPYVLLMNCSYSALHLKLHWLLCLMHLWCSSDSNLGVILAQASSLTLSTAHWASAFWLFRGNKHKFLICLWP